MSQPALQQGPRAIEATTDQASERDVAVLEHGRAVLRTEAAAILGLADSLAEPFVRAVEVMAGLEGRVVCTGMGKSGHVARKIAATLSSTGTPAMFVHPGEASHGDLGMITTKDAVLARPATAISA